MAVPSSYDVPSPSVRSETTDDNSHLEVSKQVWNLRSCPLPLTPARCLLKGSAPLGRIDHRCILCVGQLLEAVQPNSRVFTLLGETNAPAFDRRVLDSDSRWLLLRRQHDPLRLREAGLPPVSTRTVYREDRLQGRS